MSYVCNWGQKYSQSIFFFFFYLNISKIDSFTQTFQAPPQQAAMSICEVQTN